MRASRARARGARLGGTGKDNEGKESERKETLLAIMDMPREEPEAQLTHLMELSDKAVVAPQTPVDSPKSEEEGQ